MVDSARSPKVGTKSPSRNQWGVLGDIQFEIGEAPLSFDFQEKAVLAEHPKISGKPGLQWLGEELHTIRLAFRFQAGWCNPEHQLSRLQAAKKAHLPMRLVLGKNLFAGNYIIESIRTGLNQTDLKGLMIEIQVQVELKETTDKPPTPKKGRSPFKKRQRKG